MDLEVMDFNDADAYFDGPGAAEWADLVTLALDLPLFLQASDQEGKVGQPIFDPKATNAWLTAESAQRRWHKVPVPDSLSMFGNDWDAGKNETLAEWQFSNYPFLWNNVIRTEAVFKGGVSLYGIKRTSALVVITKSGMLPASNSTLYYEQAAAQLSAVTSFGTFEVPIRLVGLTIPEGMNPVPATWTVYPGRYARQGGQSIAHAAVEASWGRPSRYGFIPVRFIPPA